MTATDNPVRQHKAQLDISKLILRAEFLSTKEKYMWIKITEQLTEQQIKQLADVFLDEENKRKILLSQLEQVEEVNQQYLRDLEALDAKYGTDTIKDSPKTNGPEVTKTIFRKLGNI